MKVHQFLDAHGITENPFAQEDAQTDTVFRDHCMKDVHHPAWDKILGKPNMPETSVVFGKRGSGKTALKLQLVHAIAKYNQESPGLKTWVIEYDDFNPFLDNFRERLSGRKRKQERAIKSWRLADHLDSVLSLGVTRLVDMITDERNGRGAVNEKGDMVEQIKPEKVREMPHIEKRDLLLLTGLYDRSFDSPRPRRWSLLRRKLRYSNWTRFWPFMLGVCGHCINDHFDRFMGWGRVENLSAQPVDSGSFIARLDSVVVVEIDNTRHKLANLTTDSGRRQRN